jgi:hypothetical protein
MEEGDRGGPTITTSETKEEKVLPTLNELSMKEALYDRDEGGLEMASNADRFHFIKIPQKFSKKDN